MNTRSFFHFEVTLTWSKIMAGLVIVLAFILDLLYTKSGAIFMFTVPFFVFLITGKQLNDSAVKKKEIEKEAKKEEIKKEVIEVEKDKEEEEVKE